MWWPHAFTTVWTDLYWNTGFIQKQTLQHLAHKLDPLFRNCPRNRLPIKPLSQIAPEICTFLYFTTFYSPTNVTHCPLNPNHRLLKKCVQDYFPLLYYLLLLPKTFQEQFQVTSTESLHNCKFQDKSQVFLDKLNQFMSRPSGYKVTICCLFPCQFLHFWDFIVNFTWVPTFYILLIIFCQLYLHCKGLLNSYWSA